MWNKQPEVKLEKLIMPMAKFHFKQTDETERTYFVYVMARTAWQGRLDSEAMAGIWHSDGLDHLRLEMLDKWDLWQGACERNRTP